MAYLPSSRAEQVRVPRVSDISGGKQGIHICPNKGQSPRRCVSVLRTGRGFVQGRSQQVAATDGGPSQAQVLIVFLQEG